MENGIDGVEHSSMVVSAAAGIHVKVEVHAIGGILETLFHAVYLGTWVALTEGGIAEILEHLWCGSNPLPPDGRRKNLCLRLWNLRCHHTQCDYVHDSDGNVQT